MSENNIVDASIIESLKEIMGDAFGVLITTFIDDTGKLVDSLAKLHKQNDLETFTRNSHSIKSSSANLGALQLSSLAAELEAQGKAGDISDVGDKIDKIQEEFKKACNELANYS